MKSQVIHQKIYSEIVTYIVRPLTADNTTITADSDVITADQTIQ